LNNEVARKRLLKDELYGQLARVGKAASAPHRLELLDLLAQAPRTVEALAEETGMSVANTSQHLQVLRGAGLVDAGRAGLHVTYRLASLEVASFLLSVRALAEARLAEVQRVKASFFTEADYLSPMSATELLRRARRGEALVLDVRPAHEYAAGHLPMALSVPLAELRKRLADLPKGKDVVAYCRGPYCVFAADAVRMLRRKGFRAFRFEDGVSEWRARGLPIEMSSGGGR
jgi:rhodanese-related sulfurtransferase/DNA-binding transcriptional ArsR family regulator